MLGQYILSVICASLILGILCAFLDGKSTAGVLLRTAGGIMLAVTAVQPLVRFDFQEVEDFLSDFQLQAEGAALYGQTLAAEENVEYIKERCEAYILDKAQSWGGSLTAEVTVEAGEIPRPVSAVLRGSISAGGRAVLTQMMERDLNIPEEKQTWIGIP